MRSKLELWKIIQENFNDYFYKGLCHTIQNIYAAKFISANEAKLLLDDLEEYAKGEGIKFYEEYFWESFI